MNSNHKNAQDELMQASRSRELLILTTDELQNQRESSACR